MKIKTLVLCSIVLLVSFLLLTGCSSEPPQEETDQVEETEIDEVVEEDVIGPGQFIFARSSTTPTHYFDSAYIVEITEDSVVFNWADTYAKGEDGRTYPNSPEYYHAVKPMTEDQIEVSSAVMLAPKGTCFVYYVGQIVEVDDGQYIVNYLMPGYDEEKVDTCSDLSRLFVIIGE